MSSAFKVPTLKLPAVLKLNEFASKAQSFSDLLPYGVKIADDILLNIDGSLMATYRYRGADLASASEAILADVNQRVNDAVSRLGAGWMIHVTSERTIATDYPTGSHFPDATSFIIDESRRSDYQKEGNHYVNYYWMDITYLPQTDTANKGEEFLIEGQREVGAVAAANEALKHFNEHLSSFEGMLGPDLNLERVGCKIVEEDEGSIVVDEQTSHLIKCASLRDILISRSAPETHIAPLVACVTLRNGFNLRIGDEVVAVLNVNGLPPVSYAGMFDVLNQIAYSYRVSWRFIVRDSQAAIKDIEKERSRWFGKRRKMSDALQGKESTFPDLDAVSMANDANQALANARSGDASFGYYTMSIVFSEKINPDETEQEAWANINKKVDHVASYLHRMHCQTFYERENVLEAFLGTLPGIGHAQLRRPMLSSRNFADFIPTTAVWTGSLTNPCGFYPPDSPPLAYVSTNGSTPFALNLHVGDVGHFLMAGETGGGKSVALGFLLAQHRRYINSRQIVFDIGRSHYTLCKAVGGRHYDVGNDLAVGFCPLAHINEPAERAWAEGWIASLVALQGFDPLKHREGIFKSLEAFARTPGPYSLSDYLSQPFVHPEVKLSVEYYTIKNESLQGLLDAEADTLQDSDFICFEMSALMDFDKKVQEPVLTYLFHYVERLCTGRPTLLVLEEVWTFLDNAQASEAVKRWLKTLRKANVAVGFATQSLGDLMNSKIRDALIGSCMTKIYLANPEARSENASEAYHKMGLLSHQIRQLSRAQRKRDYYFTSPEGKRMVSFDLSPVTLAFIGVSDKDSIAKIKRMIDEENTAIREHPETLKNRYPWQAQWIVEKLGDNHGQEWARYWVESWKERGGWQKAITLEKAQRETY